MDEQLTQKIKAISREIVHDEFPDEEEYFDFLSDLTLEEIEELEPGKELEFLNEMRAVHPELVLGFTPLVIIFVTQVLAEAGNQEITDDNIKKRILSILKDENKRKKVSELSKYLRDIEG